MDNHKIASELIDRLIASGEIDKIDREEAIEKFKEELKQKSFEKLTLLAENLSDTAIIEKLLVRRKELLNKRN